ncbi:hypothetical protein GmHk_11G033176 [Glycine max]|nr:hypothetical protein GmHk_11G033176 [Glycine max]
MNTKKGENIIGVFPKRRTLIRYRKLQGNRDTTVYPTTLDHNIQSTPQGIVLGSPRSCKGTGTRRCTPPHLTTTFSQRRKALSQALRIGEHLSRVMNSDDCSPD